MTFSREHSTDYFRISNLFVKIWETRLKKGQKWRKRLVLIKMTTIAKTQFKKHWIVSEILKNVILKFLFRQYFSLCFQTSSSQTTSIFTTFSVEGINLKTIIGAKQQKVKIPNFLNYPPYRRRAQVKLWFIQIAIGTKVLVIKYRLKVRRQAP